VMVQEALEEKKGTRILENRDMHARLANSDRRKE
jgi:hypothetical protein